MSVMWPYAQVGENVLDDLALVKSDRAIIYWEGNMIASNLFRLCFSLTTLISLLLSAPANAKLPITNKLGFALLITGSAK